MKNIYNKTALIITITTLLIGSCSEDFLDQKPTSSLTELSYYKNVVELETSLVATYGALGSIWGFEIDHWGTGDVGSDDADKGSEDQDQHDLIDVSYSRQTATNGWCAGFWYDCYYIIARANKVIENSNFTGTQGDTIEIRKIVNQAKFIRAMCFYHLVTTYGDVPLVNKFLNPDELNQKRAPAAEIWAQIESDLKDATNLPAKKEWNQSGRVTSGAAWALLGKVYLTEGKNELANHAFYQVVNSHQYQLVNNFGFIFRHEGENCEESIFEIQHSNTIPGGSLCSWNAAFRLPRDNAAGGWGFDCPTKDLLNEFEPGDPRIIYTFIFPGDVFPIDESNNYTAENVWSPTGYNSRKAWIPWSERLGVNADFNNWDINYRYMRYAEVLLLYAESLNKVNKPDSALWAVNLVRDRARNTPTTDPQRIFCNWDLSHTGILLPAVTTTDQSDLEKAIWHEQRVELAIEGHRRNALLRTGRFKERMEKAKAYANVTVEPYELLFPIYPPEIQLSNGMLTQNPGY